MRPRPTSAVELGSGTGSATKCKATPRNEVAPSDSTVRIGSEMLPFPCGPPEVAKRTPKPMIH